MTEDFADVSVGVVVREIFAPNLVTLSLGGGATLRGESSWITRATISRSPVSFGERIAKVSVKRITTS